VEHFSKRTTASLFVALLLLALSFGSAIELIGRHMPTPTAHCDSHLHFSAGS
jgi:hypothetical protein